jgi:methylthioribulose-1-phosphate dehydratase
MTTQLQIAEEEQTKSATRTVMIEHDCQLVNANRNRQPCRGIWIVSAAKYNAPYEARFMTHADEAIRQLCQAGASLAAHGWLEGTSGNLSATLAYDPVRLLITSSGQDKGTLTPASFVEVDAHGRMLWGDGQPSAETSLHTTIVRHRAAGSVLHVHSPWATVLSDFFAPEQGISISGYEMLKGLAGVRTHEHTEWLPILENTQDYPALTAQLDALLLAQPNIHGVLLRRHGLYTWGTTVAEARRHVEIIEFLLEVTARTATLQGRFAGQ